MAKRAKKNYVNNAEFYEAMVKYKQDCRDAEESGEDIPRIPNYIGECIFHIANRLSYKPNFINYTYRDDMISDGIENAIMCVRNFNPEKSKNPFAYFTQVIYFAFIRRIQKEKKQMYVKHKVIENSVMTGTAVSGSDTSDNGDAAFIDLNNDYMNNFVENYEASMDKKKKQREEKKKEGLENFYDDEDKDS
jgi:DNA-directed RNA polymerase specialized sigma subunit